MERQGGLSYNYAGVAVSQLLAELGSPAFGSGGDTEAALEAYWGISGAEKRASCFFRRLASKDPRLRAFPRGTHNAVCCASYEDVLYLLEVASGPRGGRQAHDAQPGTGE